MTMTESELWETGSLEIRSMEMDWKGVDNSTAKGVNPGMVGRVFTLADWQAAHPKMNLCRKVVIPSHQ